MTQADWLARIETWVPKWMLEQSVHVQPVLGAFATVMASNEAERDLLLAQTFIGTASTEYLETLGAERDVQRNTPESNAALATRMRTKHIVSECDKVSIKTAVDSLLIKGSCTVVEDDAHNEFFTPGMFFNQGVILNPTHVKDAFSILVDKQTHDPVSFLNRGNYFNEAAFTGDAGSSEAVLKALITIVNGNRALGALFRVFERHT